jgi:hypothetical protein
MDQTALNAANQVLADLVQNGGGTYEQGTLLPFTPKVGYAVGIGGVRYPAAGFDAEVVFWLSRAVATEYETSYVGTWLKDGTVHLDAVRYFGPERAHQALACAYYYGQEAIYDFAAGESVYVDEKNPDDYNTIDPRDGGRNDR